MKKYLKVVSSLILIIATVSSCGKKEDEVVPVESETVSLNYTAVSSNLTNPITVFPISKGPSASITWNNAALKISNLIFAGKRNNILEEYKTIPVTDFIFTSTSIKLASVSPTSGAYTEASLKIEFRTSFAGAPFTLSGVYTDRSGEDWQVLFVLNENLTLNFSSTDVDLKKGIAYNELISFDWNELTKNLTTGDFPLGSKTGVKEPIVISSTSNIPLFQKIKANLVNIAKVAIN